MPPKAKTKPESTEPVASPEPEVVRRPELSVEELLRQPFPAQQIGKLPRITCGACRDTRAKVCDRHTKRECAECKNWITTAHMHLDYVGHAAATSRLLDADPDWNWAPAYHRVDPEVLKAACASGNPEIVRLVIENSPPLQDERGMWMNLTVNGVTRMGYATDDRGGMDHNKILIGDGIRNAGMRFGLALDLWSKEDLAPGANDSPSVNGQTNGHANGQVNGHSEAPKDEAAAQPKGSGRDWIAEAKQITDLQLLLKLGQECNAFKEFVGDAKEALLARREELMAEQAKGEQAKAEQPVQDDDKPPY